MKANLKYEILIIFTGFLFLLTQCVWPADKKNSLSKRYEQFRISGRHYAKSFVFPVGIPAAKGYYIAQKFRVRNKNFGNNYHLGEDWNGKGGGNTDLGDPVYSIAEGLVIFARDGGEGWGNVVRILHKIKNKNDTKFVESLYAHLEKMYIKEGMTVKVGHKLGTMGNVGGIYYAHLHFELRTKILLPLGGGYAENTDGFTDPSAFIKRMRKN